MVLVKGGHTERSMLSELDRRVGRSLLSQILSFQSTDRCRWVSGARVLESNSQPSFPLAMEQRILQEGAEILQQLWSRETAAMGAGQRLLPQAWTRQAIGGRVPGSTFDKAAGLRHFPISLCLSAAPRLKIFKTSVTLAEQDEKRRKGS